MDFTHILTVAQEQAVTTNLQQLPDLLVKTEGLSMYFFTKKITKPNLFESGALRIFWFGIFSFFNTRDAKAN